MISRREWLGMSLGAGATLALKPQLLSALNVPQREKLIQRAIPSTGEMLPVISFGPRPTDGAAIKEVLKTLVDNGGKMVDVLHGGPPGEQGARTAAAELGIQNKLFWTTPLSVDVPVLPGYSGPPVKPDAAAVRAAMEEKFARFKVPMIDLVMVSSAADVPTHLAVLREMKKERRVRYIGVHDLLFPPNAPAPAPATARLESIMRNEEIDFVGTDYSVGDRRVEQTLLPLAQTRKIGFLAYFPFDRSRIFQRASTMPLPEWAAEFDAKTWAQFFLKYVISHPAVIVARTGTTKAEHMLDNIAGGIGRLPNDTQRKRMAELVDSFPPTPAPAPPQPQQQPPQPPAVVLAAAVLDGYVGEYKYVASGQTVTFRRDGDRMLMKISGNLPEGPIVARSETRFQGPFGLVIEFQLDGQGKTTGAIVEQGPFRIPLERK
ncbi:MAG TPA: aldo/keto reductase [Gemmatimonadaceae bacterium]|nr:aldo/keto reductase [Gemmatimonadaceae bacterium]